jgi:hypothetical protein
MFIRPCQGAQHDLNCLVDELSQIAMPCLSAPKNALWQAQRHDCSTAERRIPQDRIKARKSRQEPAANNRQQDVLAFST